MTEDQKKAYSQNPNPQHAGVEATIDMLRWLWDTGFSAVAGDAISWEVGLDPSDGHRVDTDGEKVYPPVNPDLFLHEYIIAGWGMPIGKRALRPGIDSAYHVSTGEMFDLEALSRTCAELQRWTFFVASTPFNMPGGVCSPPNIMAIF